MEFSSFGRGTFFGIARLIRYLHPHIIPFQMIKNYFKTAIRNLLKSKTFTMINVFGLALGMCCSLLIALWVSDEYGIDSFHKDSERIFVVTSCEFSGDEMNGSYDTPGMLGEEMKKVLPEVEYACNYAWGQFHTFAVGDKVMKIEGNFAGTDFFSIFSYPLILGNEKTALKSPESIAISRSMAVKLFGSPELAMDNSVLFENYRDLKVTAVFEDFGDNASERFEYLINWDFFIERNSWVKNWHNSGPTTVIKLAEHATSTELKEKIRHFIKSYDNQYSERDRLELGLQPYAEKYLHGNFENGYVSGGRIEYVRLYQWVAIFILLIACVNFMNLSTSRSGRRAKEIGIRKVNGAMKHALVGQFMLESFIVTGIAMLLAMVLLQSLLPQFNLLTGKHISSPLGDSTFWTGIGVLTLATAVVSGSYPAVLLSSFKPMTALKDTVRVSPASVFLRKGLVVFQFGLSIIFIVGMIVVSWQVDYISNKNLGYTRDNLLYLPLTGAIADNFDAFKHEALQLPGIAGMSKVSQRPFLIENSTGSVEWEGKDPNSLPTFSSSAIGYDFIESMQATLLLGRDFSEEYADSANYIINEAALKVIGYENPIGMPLTFGDVKGEIVGVINDFHFNSLHVPIKPLVLRLSNRRMWGVALIRIEAGKMSEALTGLESLHGKLNPDFPFAHQFADEEYAYLHQSEKVGQSLSLSFAVLAVFISSLGLLGLVILTTEQRTKEIGIRKVLGASVSQLVTLLSKDFMKLILFAVVLSSPVAYMIMTHWLQRFEYHVEIHWWMFVLAASCAVVVAMLTLSARSIRAAMANPVDSLKAE